MTVTMVDDSRLTATVAELSTIRLREEIPESVLSRGIAAEIAWKVASSLRQRQETAEGSWQFTAHEHEGEPGWNWQGSSVAAEVRLAGPAGQGTDDTTIHEVRNYLRDTGNLIGAKAGCRPVYWLPAQWQDGPPRPRARNRRPALTAARLRQYRRDIPARPEPGAEDLDEFGVIGPDQFWVLCRFCPTTGDARDPGKVAEVRRHEREAHPDEYAAATTHVCPMGSPGPQCQWAAESAEAFGQHLGLAHLIPAHVRIAIVAQGASLAASLRPRSAAPLALAPVLAGAEGEDWAEATADQLRAELNRVRSLLAAERERGGRLAAFAAQARAAAHLALENEPLQASA